tara:strand:+ start:719 stop:2371 length:1653 start_codon:yes stop_codon:yes gene_type:complete
MLKTLNIKDFALVDNLDINFETGLTVITGESGAGKSILLGALALAMGERADGNTVRPGARRAEIIAEFSLANHARSQAFLRDNSLDDSDQPDRCLLRRSINSDGRSRAFVNSVPVTLQVLRQLTVDLIELHGQDENQRLIRPQNQLSLIDDYGVDKSLLESCSIAYKNWNKTKAKLSDLKASLENNEDRAALLRYQIEELDTLGLSEGEFAALSGTQKRLSHLAELRHTIAEVQEILKTKELLSKSERLLSEIDDDDRYLYAAKESLRSANELLDDTAKSTRSYFDSLEDDPILLSEIDERLGSIFELARKHRIGPENLPAQLQMLNEELKSISIDESELDELLEKANQYEHEYLQLARKISKRRHQIAEQFCKEVSACMQTLGIINGELLVHFHEVQSESGLETVEFMVITNPKYPAATLKKIASGGERSRISLAICIVTSAKTELPSLVLDEADVGVGGATADVVGRLLRNLAGNVQVICVTHAPQVAALGDLHLKVDKDKKQDTHIDYLKENDRIEEIARMLAGSGITAESRNYAKTLIEDAKNKIH